jgi:dTDP-4-dehydrorhamnose reductase
MRVAVLGAAGLFGHALVSEFQQGHSVSALTRQDADITRLDELRAIFTKIQPEVVLHPASIPDLDICETEPAKAFLVNVHGTRNVMAAAREVGAAVAYISTDAVFDGKKIAPYVESDPAIPPTVYGRTKLRAEAMVRDVPHHWIFRVSVLFGPGKPNFVSKGLAKIKRGEAWIVAADQKASATYTPDASAKIREVVEAGRYGFFHLSNSGACTRLDLARRATEFAGLDLRLVVGRPSSEMSRPAKRLQNAVMEMRALGQAGFAPMRPWEGALEEYVKTAHL